MIEPDELSSLESALCVVLPKIQTMVESLRLGALGGKDVSRSKTIGKLDDELPSFVSQVGS